MPQRVDENARAAGFAARMAAKLAPIATNNSKVQMTLPTTTTTTTTTSNLPETHDSDWTLLSPLMTPRSAAALSPTTSARTLALTTSTITMQSTPTSQGHSKSLESICSLSIDGSSNRFGSRLSRPSCFSSPRSPTRILSATPSTLLATGVSRPCVSRPSSPSSCATSYI